MRSTARPGADQPEEPYFLPAGAQWFQPVRPVTVRPEEYSPEGFTTLLAMQKEHFWYVGRHRFLHHAYTRSVREYLPNRTDLRVIDLGGGCGGWVRYLLDRTKGTFVELALADASPIALQAAGAVAGPDARRYQVDLLDLGWENRWDVVFLLDVLEHIPDDGAALRQIAKALRPGGLLFLACPALRFFWSWNDVVAHHCRRYSAEDYHLLADTCGLELCRARYFMFLLSPLLWLSRAKGPDISRLREDEVRALVERTHRIPPYPANAVLSLLFSAETPLGWYFPFPWGTSLLGVFRKPVPNVPSNGKELKACSE